jgi:hypothetical protein
MIEILKKMFEANPEKSTIALKCKCSDCGCETNIEITPASTGFGLQGGFLFKSPSGGYFAKCPDCKMKRRNHKRFKVQAGVYVNLKDIHYKIGQLIDISKGGCAFLYIANGEKINGRFNCSIDLFSGTEAFYLRNMSFKTISDFSQNNEPPFAYGKIRRCGGQFDKLTQTQKIQLDYFIKSHTTN